MRHSKFVCRARIVSGVSLSRARNSSTSTSNTSIIAERHGPHVARTEVVSLTVFDGPLTVA